MIVVVDHLLNEGFIVNVVMNNDVSFYNFKVLDGLKQKMNSDISDPFLGG